jgi:hypothetical protein
MAMRVAALGTMRAIVPASTQTDRFKARMTAGREIGNHVAQQVLLSVVRDPTDCIDPLGFGDRPRERHLPQAEVGRPHELSEPPRCNSPLILREPPRQDPRPGEKQRELVVPRLGKVVVANAAPQPVKACGRSRAVREPRASTQPPSRLDEAGSLQFPKRMATSAPWPPATITAGPVGHPERPAQPRTPMWNEPAAHRVDREQEQLGR